MWEAVVAPGRLADAEQAVRAVAEQARAGGHVADSYSDGIDRVVLIVAEEATFEVDPALVARAHAWTFDRL